MSRKYFETHLVHPIKFECSISDRAKMFYPPIFKIVRVALPGFPMVWVAYCNGIFPEWLRDGAGRGSGRGGCATLCQLAYRNTLLQSCQGIAPYLLERLSKACLLHY